jgi:catechol 2,3-dioxygenase-like lactoylglutathione lyase family enzyme
MIKVSRLAHIVLQTPDVAKQTDYYVNTMGLFPVSKTADRVHLATRIGELAIILVRGQTARCLSLAFQVPPSTDFVQTLKILSSEGIIAVRRSDPLPGIADVVVFSDVNGTELQLFRERKFESVRSSGGIAPMKIGHVAFVVDDPKATSAFYERLLGFRVSDWVEEYFVFMRCGPDHHTVNFLKAPGRRMHHFAFEMRDAAHLIESCDVLGREQLEITWGPVRHGPGHNIASYHLNTDGLMIELYAELDKMLNEELGHFEPRPWHRDRPQKPKVWSGQGRRDVWGPTIPQNFLLQGG